MVKDQVAGFNRSGQYYAGGFDQSRRSGVGGLKEINEFLGGVTDQVTDLYGIYRSYESDRLRASVDRYRARYAKALMGRELQDREALRAAAYHLGPGTQAGVDTQPARTPLIGQFASPGTILVLGALALGTLVVFRPGPEPAPKASYTVISGRKFKD